MDVYLNKISFVFGLVFTESLRLIQEQGYLQELLNFMGSILAMSYAAVTADIDLMKRHAIGFGFQILVSVGTAALFAIYSST